MSYLYRGVSKELDSKNQGKLRPKGNQAKIAMPLVENSPLKVDGSWVLGETEENTLREHQLDIPTKQHKGCLISTTRSKCVAHHFATTENIEIGFIYIIDESKLAEFGVIAFEKVFSENEHEKEVSLRAKDCGDLPSEIIFRKILVQPK